MADDPSTIPAPTTTPASELVLLQAVTELLPPQWSDHVRSSLAEVEPRHELLRTELALQHEARVLQRYLKNPNPKKPKARGVKLETISHLTYEFKLMPLPVDAEVTLKERGRELLAAEKNTGKTSKRAKLSEGHLALAMTDYLHELQAEARLPLFFKKGRGNVEKEALAAKHWKRLLARVLAHQLQFLPPLVERTASTPPTGHLTRLQRLITTLQDVMKDVIPITHANLFTTPQVRRRERNHVLRRLFDHVATLRQSSSPSSSSSSPPSSSLTLPEARETLVARFITVARLVERISQRLRSTKKAIQQRKKIRARHAARRRHRQHATTPLTHFQSHPRDPLIRTFLADVSQHVLEEFTNRGIPTPRNITTPGELVPHLLREHRQYLEDVLKVMDSLRHVLACWDALVRAQEVLLPDDTLNRLDETLQALERQLRAVRDAVELPSSSAGTSTNHRREEARTAELLRQALVRQRLYKNHVLRVVHADPFLYGLLTWALAGKTTLFRAYEEHVLKARLDARSLQIFEKIRAEITLDNAGGKRFKPLDTLTSHLKKHDALKTELEALLRAHMRSNPELRALLDDDPSAFLRLFQPGAGKGRPTEPMSLLTEDGARLSFRMPQLTRHACLEHVGRILTAEFTRRALLHLILVLLKEENDPQSSSPSSSPKTGGVNQNPKNVTSFPTASLLAKLVFQKKVSIDRIIKEKLKDTFGVNVNATTVLQALIHLRGLFHRLFMRDYFVDPDDPLANQPTPYRTLDPRLTAPALRTFRHVQKDVPRFPAHLRGLLEGGALLRDALETLVSELQARKDNPRIKMFLTRDHDTQLNRLHHFLNTALQAMNTTLQEWRHLKRAMTAATHAKIHRRARGWLYHLSAVEMLFAHRTRERLAAIADQLNEVILASPRDHEKLDAQFKKLQPLLEEVLPELMTHVRDFAARYPAVSRSSVPQGRGTPAPSTPEHLPMPESARIYATLLRFYLRTKFLQESLTQHVHLMRPYQQGTSFRDALQQYHRFFTEYQHFLEAVTAYVTTNDAETFHAKAHQFLKAFQEDPTMKAFLASSTVASAFTLPDDPARTTWTEYLSLLHASLAVLLHHWGFARSPAVTSTSSPSPAPSPSSPLPFSDLLLKILERFIVPFRIHFNSQRFRFVRRILSLPYQKPDDLITTHQARPLLLNAIVPRKVNMLDPRWITEVLEKHRKELEERLPAYLAVPTVRSLTHEPTTVTKPAITILPNEHEPSVNSTDVFKVLIGTSVFLYPQVELHQEGRTLSVIPLKVKIHDPARQHLGGKKDERALYFVIPNWPAERAARYRQKITRLLATLSEILRDVPSEAEVRARLEQHLDADEMQRRYPFTVIQAELTQSSSTPETSLRQIITRTKRHLQSQLSMNVPDLPHDVPEYLSYWYHVAILRAWTWARQHAHYQRVARAVPTNVNTLRLMPQETTTAFKVQLVIEMPPLPEATNHDGETPATASELRMGLPDPPDDETLANIRELMRTHLETLLPVLRGHVKALQDANTSQDQRRELLHATYVTAFVADDAHKPNDPQAMTVSQLQQHVDVDHLRAFVLMLTTLSPARTEAVRALKMRLQHAPLKRQLEAAGVHVETLATRADLVEALKPREPPQGQLLPPHVLVLEQCLVQLKEHLDTLEAEAVLSPPTDVVNDAEGTKLGTAMATVIQEVVLPVASMREMAVDVGVRRFAACAIGWNAPVLAGSLAELQSRVVLYPNTLGGIIRGSVLATRARQLGGTASAEYHDWKRRRTREVQVHVQTVPDARTNPPRRTLIRESLVVSTRGANRAGLHGHLLRGLTRRHHVGTTPATGRTRRTAWEVNDLLARAVARARDVKTRTALAAVRPRDVPALTWLTLVSWYQSVTAMDVKSARATDAQVKQALAGTAEVMVAYAVPRVLLESLEFGREGASGGERAGLGSFSRALTGQKEAKWRDALQVALQVHHGMTVATTGSRKARTKTSARKKTTAGAPESEPEEKAGTMAPGRRMVLVPARSTGLCPVTDWHATRMGALVVRRRDPATATYRFQAGGVPPVVLECKREGWYVDRDDAAALYLLLRHHRELVTPSSSSWSSRTRSRPSKPSPVRKKAKAGKKPTRVRTKRKETKRKRKDSKAKRTRSSS